MVGQRRLLDSCFQNPSESLGTEKQHFIENLANNLLNYKIDSSIIIIASICKRYSIRMNRVKQLVNK